jgi:cytochrome c-type biogenesis protein CcmH
VHRRILAAALLVFALWATPGAGDGPTFQEIEESLTCQCGCGLTVHSCNHLQCPSALPLRAEIREQMAAGKNKAELLAYFGEKYGEKILSAPTTAGFNLLAWVTPFVAVSVGVLIVLLIARRWQRGPRPPSDTDQAPPLEQPPSPYRDILERELKSFDQ